jgi:hypothetical protein
MYLRLLELLTSGEHFGSRVQHFSLKTKVVVNPNLIHKVGQCLPNIARRVAAFRSIVWRYGTRLKCDKTSYKTQQLFFKSSCAEFTKQDSTVAE